MIKTYKVAFYLRLSREDGDDMESESISNQRDFLNMYLKKTTEKLIYVNEYIDDGFSGGNFDRPSWRKLLIDIDNKVVDTIITKDLSRMGRDYISMGEYVEKIFPERGIRYIAVNDDIDTLYETPGLEFLQFKLLFNDFYLKDTSKKIRKVVRSKKEQGQFLGWKAVYGYVKDPCDKHRLIVDENIRPIVKRIFNLVLEGKSPRQVANILSDEGVPTPSVYANLNRGIKSSAYELWCPRTISEMLVNETYIGNLTQGKRKKLNYKSKKEVRVPRENWIIIEDTHEAIIDKETFYTVQGLLKKNRNKVNKKNLELLSGFMFCKECGHAIGINRRGGKRSYCYCTFYASHSKYGLCTPHSCNYEKLEMAVLSELRSLCEVYVDVSGFESKVEEVRRLSDVRVSLVKNIGILDNKIKQNLCFIDKLYEDRLREDIDIAMFNRLSLRYREEIKNLEKSIKEMEKELSRMSKSKDEVNLLKMINDFLSFENPSRKMLVNLIDKIYIDKDKQVEIYYKFKV